MLQHEINIVLHSSSPAWGGAQIQFPYLLCINNIIIILQIARPLEDVPGRARGTEQTWYLPTED